MFPTYIELEGFVEIARLGSISRAAQSLGMSQPSLSQSLKKLEGRVGAPLFLRRKSGVELTTAGEAVLSEANEMMTLWKRTVSSASFHSKILTGKMRIGCHISVAQYALAALLRCIHSEFPHVKVILSHDLSRRLVDQVLHNEIDLALAINPFRSSELILRHLVDDQITLFTKGRVHSLEEIQKIPLIVDPNLNQTQSILRKLYADGLRFERILETSSLEVCGALLRDGIGTSVLPSRVQRLYLPKAFAVPDAPTYKDELKLVYRADKIANPASRSFMRRVEAALRGTLD